MEGGSLGGGQRQMGLFDIISSGINGYKAAKQEKADEDLLQQGIQAEYAAGVTDPRQALMNVLQKNPALIAHDAFKDNSTIQEMLHPPSRQYFAAGPGSTIFDAGTGKPTATVPGKPGMGMSSEVQQALVAAGWKGDAPPTDAQYAGAAKLLGQHLQRPPTEFEDVMSHLSGPQRQQYLEHLAGNNPNSGVANEITKLTQLERQAQAAGDTVAAQRYGTAAQKVSEQPGLLSLFNNPNLGAPPQSNDQPSPQPPLPTDQSGNPLATPSDNSIPQPPPEKPPVPGGDDDGNSSAAAGAAGDQSATPSMPTYDPQAIVNELRNRGIQIQ